MYLYLLNEEVYKRRVKDGFEYSEGYKFAKKIIDDLKNNNINISLYSLNFPTKNGILKRFILVSDKSLDSVEILDKYIIKSQNLDSIVGSRKFRIYERGTSKIKDCDYPAKCLRKGIYASLRKDNPESRNIKVLLLGNIDSQKIEEFFKVLNKKTNGFILFVNKRRYKNNLNYFLKLGKSIEIEYEIIPLSKEDEIMYFAEKLSEDTDLLLIIVNRELSRDNFSKIKVKSIIERNIYDGVFSKISRVQFISIEEIEEVLKYEYKYSEKIAVNIIGQILYKLDFLPFCPTVGGEYKGKELICAIGFSKGKEKNTPQIHKLVVMALPTFLDYAHIFMLTDRDYFIKSSKSFEFLNKEEWETILDSIFEYSKRLNLNNKSDINLIFLRRRPFLYKEYKALKTLENFKDLYKIFNKIFFISSYPLNRQSKLNLGVTNESKIILDKGLAVIKYKLIKKLLILQFREIGEEEYKIPNTNTTQDLVRVYEWIRLYSFNDISNLPDKVSLPFILRTAKKYAKYYSLANIKND